MYNKNKLVNDDVLAYGDPLALSKWLQERRIDPNHPDNVGLVPYLTSSDGKEGKFTADYFRLEQLQVVNSSCIFSYIFF